MTFQANITKPENVAVQTTESLTQLQVTRAVHSNGFRRREEKGGRRGQDLWSHLASNSFTFCSLQLQTSEAGGGPKDQGPELGAGCHV